MRIVGEWQAGEDGVTRPVLQASVRALDGTLEPDVFLIDSGADRTVFSANLLRRLGFPMTPAPGSSILLGISGVCESVVVKTVVELTRDDRGVVHMRGDCAAFIDSSASNLSILGRDILNLFDVILSRRRGEVVLLAPNHQYRVEQV
jgi:hypothetical protein